MRKNGFLALIMFFIVLFIGVSIFYIIQLNSNKVIDDPTKKVREIGVISEITPKGDYGTIFIERDVYKAYVTIDENTVITDSKNTKGLSFDDLKIGDRVEVTVPEIVIEIYPYQYTTERVVILD